MSDNKSVQHAFLEHLLNTRQESTVFLVNGVKLQGVITWVDDDCLLLSRDGLTQIVYKHSISTVMPSERFNLYDIIGEAADGHGNR